MNGLGEALAWLSATITLIAAMGLVLERLASRAGPRAGVWVAATSLVMVIMTTVLAFCPVPDFFTRRGRGLSGPGGLAALEATSHSLPATGRSTESIDKNSALVRPDSPGRLSWDLLLKRLGAGLERRTASFRLRPPALPAPCCVVLLLGSTSSLLRLLFGLWGVRDCRRRSAPIDDPAVLALVNDLRRDLGVKRSVEVRELLELATAAAVGWRRPLVLLPHGWWSWSQSERRAVLAHELTHIARGDYALGVIARFSLAVHFYHPLVHWIYRRLQLQQELAADADGASLVGGHRPYLLALSRLRWA